MLLCVSVCVSGRGQKNFYRKHRVQCLKISGSASGFGLLNTHMHKTLAVITHSGDWWQFRFLVHTLLRKARGRETVIVVINEPRSVADQLLATYKTERQYRKFTRKHRVRWLCTEDVLGVFPHDDGWVTQQVLKIAVSESVETDHYVCLDSKNFFVDKFTSADLLNSEPNQLQGYSESRVRTSQYYCDLFGVQFEGRSFLHNITPFVMETGCSRALVEHFRGAREFSAWFTAHALDGRYSPMEFHLYDVFASVWGAAPQQYHPAGCNYSTLWDHMIARYGWNWRQCITEIHRMRSQGVVVSGMHKSFIELVPFKHTVYIMYSLGFREAWQGFEQDYLATQEGLRERGRLRAERGVPPDRLPRWDQ